MLSLTRIDVFRTIGVIGCFIFFPVFFGCGETTGKSNSNVLDTGHGDLPYLKKTTHPDLRKEYSLLVEQQHTPTQLVQPDKEPLKNAAVAIRRVLRKSKADEILKETQFLTQGERFEFNSLHLKRIEELAEDYHYKILLVTEAMQLPYCVFPYNYTQGLMADDSFVEQVLAASRLQEIGAADNLYNSRSGIPPENNVPEKEEADKAIDPTLKNTLERIQTIFQLVNRLGEVKQIRSRLIAASIRKEACRILEATVNDPRCNRTTLVELQRIVQEELAHWPSDAEMWIGDRAIGLYVYEVVRDGLILSVLTDDEIETFRQAGTLKHLTDATQETADEDQLYYLTTMRNLIDLCRRDFHERPLLGSKIVDDLEQRETSPNYPIVAGQLLLREVDNALLLQTIDLARIRAWAVALAIALGEEPQNNLNPITGRPYFVTQTDKAVTVRVVPEENDTEIKNPLDTEAQKFIATQLRHPAVVPKLR